MRTASNAYLVDTNVLVYPYDPRDPSKQERAIAVLDALIDADRAVLSAQSLAEFFRVVTERLPQKLTAADALGRVEDLARTCAVIDVTRAVAIEACRGAAAHRLAIWDALIWAAARLNQIPYVLTEDAEHGRVLEGVAYLDPFDARFDLAGLSARR